MARHVHIHLGPHRTGAAAIRQCLAHMAPALARTGLTFVDPPALGSLATAFRKEDPEAIQTATQDLTRFAATQAGDLILSSADLAGELPGSTQRRRPYPKLFRNLQALDAAFPGDKVTFYMLRRDPANWLASVYLRHLTDLSKFASFDRFRGFLHDGEVWDTTFRKARNRLGARFVEIAYEEGAGFSAPQALLDRVLGAQKLKVPPLPRVNAAPDLITVSLLEAVNRSGASEDAKSLARAALQRPAPPSAPDAAQNVFPNWPRPMQPPRWLSQSLTKLWDRVTVRVHRQSQPNLMPGLQDDLTPYRSVPVAAEDAFPDGGRADMENQVRILAHRFRGQPQTCFLLGLSISYLRRNTDHTAHAAALFQRLWAEEHDILLGCLATRWLISTFQTFLDHGANEQQRVLGAAAYFMSNTLKAYETERALEGLAPDATYPNTAPVTKSGYPGLDRFKLGGSDLMLNTNALLLELAAQDDVAGRVVQEFMLRTKAGHSMFSRMDQSRIAHDITIPQFSNCWSFFERPKT